MKFSSSIVTLLLSALFAADGLSFSLGSGLSQKVLGDGSPVPGDNPLSFCQKDHSDDLLTLEKVDLNPNPPLKGTTLTITAVGTLLEDVKEGAYVVLQVKYGLIRLVNTEADLCEQVSNVDMTCPVKKGLTKIKKDVELPKEIPPGTYTVFADVYTARPESKKIICLEATVPFA